MTSRGQSPRDSEFPGAPDAPADLDDDDPEQEEAERRYAESRSGLERILPELLRRGFEAGRVPLERVSESIFPRDIAANLVSQLGDLRSGVVKAVAHEVGRFLREADIASEVRKVLTGLDIEASVKLRFKARDDGTVKPDLEVDLGSSAEAEDKPSRPPPERRNKR